MTILMWREILERVLQGLLELVESRPAEERKELKASPLFKELKSSSDLHKPVDFKTYKDKYDASQLGDEINRILKGKTEENLYSELERLIKERFDKAQMPKGKVVKTKSIMLSDFDIENLDGASYNLKLGNETYVTTQRLPKRLKLRDTMVIRPGEFGILLTHEYIYMPEDIVGLISLRFRYKELGLVNISGFHVDPGFRGKLIFSVYNTGPNNVVLRCGDPIFMIMFEKLAKFTQKPYAGKFSELQNIPVDIVTSLSGPSVTVLALDRRVRSLEVQLRVVEGLLIAFIVLIISILLRLISP